MAGGFLNRWSRLKSGENLEPEKKVVEQTKPELTSSPELKQEPADTKELTPSATLEDVEKIDRFAPDFSAFMKPDVDPAVQQAAMKKMFSDPHFNVMDGLDIYIDDYSKPDPIPLEMLKRMVQSDMLNIFRKDSDDETPVAQTTANKESESEEQALPLSPQTDLTSTPAAIQETGDKDPVPVDKKTS
ncbi:DUF3306 domain-containing protein [Polynucleobacter sp. 31A-FELB]|uniref:DUF3306 domain-containing protein n=1 Tax=Polynucleobacter sp. 31A-FELB TaxID=2689096 RepID=UPI001C0D11BF|nr:DUF3306 domain-containing protein [Polynucleobacter sp. 31A-FELB]MBU3587678.1 DUF3306 domain-containing protein [Polynucleobacter sp. 31A-FELB]